MYIFIVSYNKYIIYKIKNNIYIIVIVLNVFIKFLNYIGQKYYEFIKILYQKFKIKYFFKQN